MQSVKQIDAFHCVCYTNATENDVAFKEKKITIIQIHFSGLEKIFFKTLILKKKNSKCSSFISCIIALFIITNKKVYAYVYNHDYIFLKDFHCIVINKNNLYYNTCYKNF